MSNTVFSPPSRGKIVALIGAALLVALSWTGDIDRHSEEYLGEALVSGGLIYATARGINALVSLAQGTEITPPFITISVGELLDPINDLIERFSAVLLVALGSLAMQRILLEIVSQDGFSLLLTAMAAALAVCAGLRQNRYYNTLARLFVFTVFVRFSLGLVVLASGYADRHFFEQRQLAQHESMKLFQEDLRELNSLAAAGAPSEGDIALAEENLALVQRSRVEQEAALAGTVAELETAHKRLDALRSATCGWNPLCRDTPEITRLKREIQQLETAVSSGEAELATLETAVAEQRESIACLKKQQRGESCSLWGRLYSSVSPSQIRKRIDSVADKTSAFSSNAIDLLMSLLIKNLLLPLFFLYTLLLAYRSTLSRLIQA